MPDRNSSKQDIYVYCGGKELAKDNERSPIIDVAKAYLRKLLSIDNIGFLLGSGTSLDAGGPSMSKISKTIIPEIMGKCFPEDNIFWPAVLKAAWEGEGKFEMPNEKDDLDIGTINIEKVAMNLIGAAALAELESKNTNLCFSNTGKEETRLQKKILKKAISIFQDIIFQLCSVPTEKSDFDDRSTHHIFLKKCLAFRRQNQRRLQIFTTNYDLLLESSCDDLGIHYINGFTGVTKRRFWPEEFDLDFHRVDPGEQPKAHFYDRVIHLIKLHGSIVWISSIDSSDPYDITELPYQTIAMEQEDERGLPLLVYPSPNKYGEVLGFPYSELFRRFNGFVSRPQTVLFTVGYGFNDEHVNAIIRQGLAHPSFTLVIIHPEFQPSSDGVVFNFFTDKVPKGHILKRLAERRDPRILFIGGELALWKHFVEDVLPDIHEEDPFELIRETLLKTSDNKEFQK